MPARPYSLKVLEDRARQCARRQGLVLSKRETLTARGELATVYLLHRTTAHGVGTF